MSRIPTPATIDAAPEAARPLLEAVKNKMGSAPNVFRIVANSPAALEGFVGLLGALDKGALDAATRERIALAVANVNGCNYCNAAHTFVGKAVAKLSDAEIAAAREGRSEDAKANAAVRLAREVAISRGSVPDSSIAQAKADGLSDAELVEVIAHVALHTLTNYVNVALETEVDFPETAPALRAAA